MFRYRQNIQCGEQTTKVSRNQLEGNHMTIRNFIAKSVLVLGTFTAAVSMYADALPGPQSVYRLISHTSEDTIRPIVFEGGRQAVVVVEAKTSTPLTVSIFRPDGTSFGTYFVAGFGKRTVWFDVPVTAGYTIRVANLSDVFVGAYSLTTN
jgi:hypothetical protein